MAVNMLLCPSLISTQENNRPWSQRFNPHGQWILSPQERRDCGSHARESPEACWPCQLRSQHSKVTVLTDGFAGYQFNSPNDVVQAKDISIWFTDPHYGYEQGFRPKPTTGNWVWRLDALGRSQRLLIDGFVKPNGISFSRDQRYVYVTDSGFIGGNGERHSLFPRTIYRYRVLDMPEGPLVAECIIFCVVTTGSPDGIKVDAQDRV